MLMGIKEIQEIIPHRHPFLLVDCIEELEPGVRAVATRPSLMMSPSSEAISHRSPLCREF